MSKILYIHVIFLILLYIINMLYFLFLYSFDVRGRSFTKALYWSDINSFGPRAFFVTVSRPAALTVENIQLDDGGVSTCANSIPCSANLIWMTIFFYFLLSCSLIQGLSMPCGLSKFAYAQPSHQFNCHG